MADYTNEGILELKKQFAKHLIKNPTDPFKATAFIFPDPKQIGNRLIAANDWPNDPIVIMEMNTLINDGDKPSLPTKEEIAFEIYNVGKRAIEPEDKLKAYKLYAELQGFVKTPGISITNNNNNKQQVIADNVMLIPVHQTEDEWQAALFEQQQRLIDIDIEKPLTLDATASSIQKT